MNARPQRLPAYAVFAALLAAAGLPIYIHAPKFYVDEHGVSLAALGTVLFGLRLLDVVQDPLLGRLSEALRTRRGASVLIGCAVMALGMLGLFAVAPPVAPIIWFALMLTLVFSAFSFLTINFYAQGVLKAETLGGQGHFQLARWRETGALIGVCVASIAPVALGAMIDRPFAGFAVGFAVLAGFAALAMRDEWKGGALRGQGGAAGGDDPGDPVRLKYRLRLPRDAGGHVLDVVDWMYLAPGGTIINRSQFRKFGIKVAELVATMRPNQMEERRVA